MSATRSITRFLTSSSKVAQAIDWRKASGSVMSLSVCKDRIELAVASHPSFQDPIQPLPSIPLKLEVQDNQKVLSSDVVEELADLVQDFNVCGMVVTWPVQKEGWCGAPCGRVLFALDQITTQAENMLSNRPVCLWDEQHYQNAEDEWGRSAIYSHTSDKTVHVASEEQYQDHRCVAADIWNDFCKVHWPELYQRRPSQTNLNGDSMSAKKNLSHIDTSWLDSYEDSSAYTKAAAL